MQLVCAVIFLLKSAVVYIARAPVAAAMPKRKRSYLRGFGGIADATLCTLLEKLRAEPALLSEGPTNRFQLKRDADAVLKMMGCKLELPMETGSFSWQCGRPALILKYLCSESAAFSNMVEATLRRLSVADRLSIVIYYDELTPGNVIALDNARKF